VSEPLPFELAALRGAVNYQSWVAAVTAPYLGARLLEVGAGLGSLSRWLPVRERLVLTERDPELLRLLRIETRERFGADPRVTVAEADVSYELPPSIAAEQLDTIVSFNVLEHVEDDAGVLARLAALLRGSSCPGPRRIVSFVPAHPWAYGSIDAAYGHVRRYTAASFRALAARSCPDWQVETRYFNVVGLPGWVLMGRILRRQSVSVGAIRWFERLCPWVRGADDVLHRLGLPLGQSLPTTKKRASGRC
jgi:SAM-dependent methyltransferase